MEKYVSITFDDFFTSASSFVLDSISDYQLKFSFYASFGKLGEIFEEEDVHRLISQGHEIGCHTYSHFRAENLKIPAFQSELTLNSFGLKEIDSNYQMKNFAYPHGSQNRTLEYLLKERFHTCRTVQKGINQITPIPFLLKANKLYDCLDNWEEIAQLISKVSQEGGWLIFYTHDVSDTPSRFGCKSDLLKRTLDLALNSGCKVQSIEEVINNYI
ncbi:MAG: polysaccharide deacetylase family protein [Flavobacteriaceae bacterium]